MRQATQAIICVLTLFAIIVYVKSGDGLAWVLYVLLAALFLQLSLFALTMFLAWPRPAARSQPRENGASEQAQAANTEDPS